MTGGGAANAIAILNPEAGHGRGSKFAATLAQIFRDAGMPIEVLVTPAPAEAARLVAEHRSGRSDHKDLLYCLLELAEWHRVFIEAPVAVAA